MQRILRHTDPRITTEVYGHLVPGYLRDAINKLPLAAAADLLPTKTHSEKEAPFGPPVVREMPDPKAKAGSASKNLSEIRPSDWLRGQDLNLRPSGYEGGSTQPADGRRSSCFQWSRVVRSDAKSTEVHERIRKSPPVWTRSGQSSGELLRTGDLRLGNSEDRDFRSSTAVHSDSKAAKSFGTLLPTPRISQSPPSDHESPGPTGVQAQPLLSVVEVARQLGLCTATVYGLCAWGELSNVRILNAIRVAPADLDAFLAARRSGARR